MTTNPAGESASAPLPAAVGLQLEHLRALIAGRSVEVIDPKAEWAQLAESSALMPAGEEGPAAPAGA